MLGIGLGVAWNNNKPSQQGPFVYSFILYGCTSIPIATVYSLSNLFEVGDYIYLDSNLTNPFTGFAANTEIPSFLNEVDEGLVTSNISYCGA